MRLHSLIATALLALAARGPLAGQTIPSPYRFYDTRHEAGAFAGWIAPGTGRFEYGPGPGPMVGARYGIEVSGPFSLEGVVTWAPTERDVIDPRRAEGARRIGTADANLLGVDARLKLSLTGPRTWHNLNPFLLAGAGAMWDVAGDDEDEDDLVSGDRFEFGTAFVGVVGGGARWFLSDHWIVRTDALPHLWKLDAPDGFRLASRGFTDVGSAEWVNASSISIGAAYRF